MTLEATLTETLGHPRFPPNRVIERINRALLRKLSVILRTFTGEVLAQRETFAFDFLMTTILALVVTKERFMIFHCGDGVIGLNGTLHHLESFSGTYLINELLAPARNVSVKDEAGSTGLKLFASGPTTDLQSIFLATDGLSRMVEEYPSQVTSFIQATPPQAQLANGFDFLLQEFREKLAWNPETVLKLDDDATFALLRRHQGSGNAPVS
jgi:serine/threonine protein phosphatase PrpC